MRKGFTLLEIVIAITLLSVISAIILPNFINSTDKARLKSDIHSAQIIQSAIDLYNIENNVSITSGSTSDVIQKLYDANYLKQPEYTPQTEGAEFVTDFNKNITKVNITNSSNAQEVYEELSEQEKFYVIK